jgi:hypothetical protein
MWDIFRERMTGSDAGDTDVGGFTSLAQCIIPRIEVFPFLCLRVNTVMRNAAAGKTATK